MTGRDTNSGSIVASAACELPKTTLGLSRLMVDGLFKPISTWREALEGCLMSTLKTGALGFLRIIYQICKGSVSLRVIAVHRWAGLVHSNATIKIPED